MLDAINNPAWTAPSEWLNIRTIDLHTEGEPLRVIVSGFPEIKGKTVLEKRDFFRLNYDHIRTGLMFEPRGHADMYGAILTEPNSKDADFGVFFLHNEGYSTMCGHAIIALTKLVIETGMITKSEKNPVLLIDVPAGRIESQAFLNEGKVYKVSFRNVQSFVYMKEIYINVEGMGEVPIDIAYGGAFYAICDIKNTNLKLEEKYYQDLIQLGKKIKKSVIENYPIRHPYENDLSFLYGTIFTGPAYDRINHSKNVCIFAEGEVDRSPTGSGVSARAALHFERGELGLNETISIESILGTTMKVKVIGTTEFGNYKAVIPEVTGTAFFTGQHNFYFDPDDPLKNGFIFR
ncbi:MAG: proline racemase family protein [Bacteroidales bacterium]|nr:proline racemase family protein [Bacteroidales bacterium]MCF8402771.1 proline racemase family protein [Bacteroidales bacterium]